MMQDKQAQLTSRAVRIPNEDFKVKLDFSNDSIKQVEKILSSIHKDYKETNDESGLQGTALAFAAYIVSTIENNFEKGRWGRDHAQFGKDSFPYYWKGGAIFPDAWCLKRIYEGSGDNIWSKYSALVLKCD